MVDFGPAFRQTQKNIGLIQEEIAKEKERTQKLKLNELDTQLANQMVEMEVQARERTESEAFGLSDDLRRQFDDFTSTLGAEITDPDVREAYESLVANYGVRLNRFGQLYEQRERDRYRDTTFEEQQKAHALDRMQSAVDPVGRVDEAMITSSLAGSAASIREYAEDTGKGKEWVDNRVAVMASEAHSSVIERLLADKRSGSAEEYFKNHGDKIIEGPAKNRLINAIRLAGVIRQVDEEVEAAFFWGATEVGLPIGSELVPLIQSGDITSHLTDKQFSDFKLKARQNIRERLAGNPELKRRSLDELERRFSEMEEREKEVKSDLFERYARLVDENPDVPVDELINPVDQAAMPARMLDALKSRRKDPQTDPILWNEFFTVFRTKPELLAKMFPQELYETYLSKFSRSDRIRAENMVLAAKEKGPEYQKLLGELQEIEMYMKANDIMPVSQEGMTPEMKRMYLQRKMFFVRTFEQFVNAENEMHKRRNEKEMDTNERRLLAAKLSAGMVGYDIPGAWHITPLFAAEFGEQVGEISIFALTDEQRKAVAEDPDVLTSIPAIASKMIVMDFKNKRGGDFEPTDEQIKKAAIAFYILRDYDAYQDVLGER
jgi:hypothetical protein